MASPFVNKMSKIVSYNFVVIKTNRMGAWVQLSGRELP